MSFKLQIERYLADILKTLYLSPKFATGIMWDTWCLLQKNLGIFA